MGAGSGRPKTGFVLPNKDVTFHPVFHALRRRGWTYLQIAAEHEMNTSRVSTILWDRKLRERHLRERRLYE
jgi:hypothetical protein